MGGIIKNIFGGGGNDAAEAQQQAAAKAERRGLAAAARQQGDVDLAKASGKRRKGSRMLTFLDSPGGNTLGSA